MGRHFQKIRIIGKDHTGEAMGVTIPMSFSYWKNVLVNVTEESGCLILKSGNWPTAMNNSDIKKQGEVMERIKI